jgi:Transposase DDE domain
LLLERMVHCGTSCLRRLSQGNSTMEIRFGRLLRHPKVTVERLIAGWSEGAAAAGAGRHVLAIQDTTELNFRTSAGHERGLGVIGKGVGHGLLLHPMIALDAGTGECLGLVGGRLWNRAPPPPGPRPPKKNNARRPLAEKESRHWIETAQDAKALASAAAMVTMIADREADFYALWASIPGPNVHVLGRICRDRKLPEGGALYGAAAAWPALGRRRIAIRERPDRPERTAELEVRAGAVGIARPLEPRKSTLPERVTLTLIEVIEPAPAPGAEPLVWRLLTSHAAPDADAAWRIVDWYRARWTIEQFFRILKQQGLRIEDSQLETADRLLKLAAIAARAAAVTLQLTQARDGQGSLDSALIFSPAELETLEAVNQTYVNPKTHRNNPYPHRSLSWAAWIIARLGGWSGSLARTSKPPGPITFKHGLDTLQTMAKGWRLRDKYIP